MKKMVSLLTSLSMLLSMGAAVIPAHASKTKSDIEGVDFESYQFYYSYDENYELTVANHMHTYYVIDPEDGAKGGYYYVTKYKKEDEYERVLVTMREGADLPSDDVLIDILGKEAAFRSDGGFDGQISFVRLPDVDYSALYAIEDVEKVEYSRLCWRSRFFVSLDKENRELIPAYIYTEDDVVLTADMFPGYSVDSISWEPNNSGEYRWVVKYKFENVRKSMEFDYLAEAIDGVISSSFSIGILESEQEVIWPVCTVEAPQYGDFDRDGTVGAADASMILAHAAASGNDGSADTAPLSAVASVFADVDRSGTVDAVDASIILSYAAEVGNGNFTGAVEQYVDWKFSVN